MLVCVRGFAVSGVIVGALGHSWNKIFAKHRELSEI